MADTPISLLSPVVDLTPDDDFAVVQDAVTKRAALLSLTRVIGFSPSTPAANRAAIQSMLDLGGNVRFALAEVYTLDTTLTVGSYTVIDLGEATLQCASGGQAFPLLMNKNEVRALTSLSGDGTTATATLSGHGYQPGQAVQIAGGTPSTMDGFYFADSVTDSTFTFASSISGSITGATVQGDHDIQVIGGTIDYNEAGTTGVQTPYPGFTLGTMGTIWINASVLFIDHNVYLDVAKFAIACWNVSKAHVSYPVFNTNSDGVHLNGPIQNCTVTMPRGTTGDDFVACTCGDYPAVDYTGGGDIDGVLVDGAQPDSVGDTNVLKFAGKSGYRIKRARVRNVDVSFTGAASAIARAIRDDVGALDATYVETLFLDGCSMRDGDFGRLVSATGIGTTIERVIINNCGINSAAPVKAVYLDQGAVIGDLAVVGLTVQGGETNNIYVLDLRSTINTVSLIACNFRSIDRILNETTTKNAGTVYFLTNVTVDDTTRTTYFQQAATVLCRSFVVKNAIAPTYSPIYTLAGNVEVYGDIEFPQGNAVRESGAGGSITRVNGLGIRTAAAAMTGGNEQNGDMFTNLTSGKPVVWQGAAYVSLIDGGAP